MELSKKTTILLTEELHDSLSRLASERGVSMGHLVREACRERYGLLDREDRLEAVRELGALELPVSSPEEMERESVPAPSPESP